MSKPDWCTQEAKRVYHSLENSHVFNEIAIARALLDAHQRGRREGMEEAAKIAYVTCAETRHVTLGDKCVAAIRGKPKIEMLGETAFAIDGSMVDLALGDKP